MTTNIELQDKIITALEYASYWDPINSLLGLLLTIAIIVGFLLGFLISFIVAGEIPDLEDSVKQVYMCFYTCVLTTILSITALIFTPSASSVSPKLVLYTSQMEINAQSCEFINSLYSNNKHYNRNVNVPEGCVVKSVD